MRIVELDLQPPKRESLFPARFDGWCGVCGEDVIEGDLIGYERDLIVHADCMMEE